jgi:hypothetical protein
MSPHLFAYLDLASGSMIIQAAIAGLVAVPILLRGQIRRLLARPGSDDQLAGDQPLATTPGPDSRPGPQLDGSDHDRP